ncbi:MAG: ATP-binding protein [Rhodothermales bacterium]|nr:ATP-binding protein [Rhodothermales bacterium]
MSERKTAEAMREQLLAELRLERERLQRLSESLEERVRERTADLARSNKTLEQRNRELQDFAYVASHDLQEPLRKIRAFADLLKADHGSALPEEGAFYVERMQDAAERMSRLISDLLDFSRVMTRARPFERVDLNDIAEDVLSDLELRCRETGAEVSIGALPSLDAERSQMARLLQNLISNGLKFHREGVPPRIEVRGGIDPDARLPGISGPVAYIEVEDNGIGFDEKYLDRIFSPFQRLHGQSDYSGTGMGLTICRRIAEHHEGTITARSTPGEGSTFIVHLPVRQERKEAAAAQEAAVVPESAS